MQLGKPTRALPLKNLCPTGNFSPNLNINNIQQKTGREPHWYTLHFEAYRQNSADNFYTRSF